MRRIIKEEADRFIAESYSGEPPVLPRDYAIDKAAVRGAYSTFVKDVLVARSAGEDYRSLPSAKNVRGAWKNKQVSAEELKLLFRDAGISEDEAFNIVNNVLNPG